MRRLSTECPFTCATCDAEIAGHAVFHLGLPFCCSACAAGGLCNGSHDEEPLDQVGAPAGRRVVSGVSVA
jgi:hypothetical protein